MSNEKFWAEAEISELGDLIKLIREEHLDLSLEELSEKIGSKVSTIKSSESGGGAHASTVLKKTCEEFGLNLHIYVSTKN